MSYIFEGDSEDGKRNRLSVIGGGGAAYNAVLSVVFSDEATTEPISLEEAKAWCRIDVADDNVLITALITAARQVCEQYSNISFINRTVTATINNGLGNFPLPYAPVKVINSVKDFSGNTLGSTDHKLRGNNLDVTGHEITQVSYTAGYDENKLPKNLKTALLNQISWMYENRGDAAIASGVSELAKLILNSVRREC